MSFARFLVLFHFFLVSLLACPTPIFTATNEEIKPARKDFIFKPGQTLEYSVTWLGIPVGRAVIKNIGVTSIKGNNCYLVVVRTFPKGFIRKFYDLEYKVYTFIDQRLLASRRFIKMRKFKNKFNYTVINFDQETGNVSYKSWGAAEFVQISKKRTENLTFKETHKINLGCQDLLSVFFFARVFAKKENEQLTAQVYYQQISWPINIKTGEVFLRDLKDKGSFPAFEIMISSPLNEFIFGRRKFLAVLTNDFWRIPLELKIGTSLGYICATIRKLPNQNL